MIVDAVLVANDPSAVDPESLNSAANIALSASSESPCMTFIGSACLAGVADGWVCVSPGNDIRGGALGMPGTLGGGTMASF